MIKILHCADIYYTHDTHIVGERLQKPFRFICFILMKSCSIRVCLGHTHRCFVKKYPGLVTMELKHKPVTTQCFLLQNLFWSLILFLYFFLLLKCWELNPGLHVYWASALLLGSIYRSTFVVLRLKQILPKAHHKNINQFLCKLGNCNFRSKKIAQAIKSLPHKHVIL